MMEKREMAPTTVQNERELVESILAVRGSTPVPSFRQFIFRLIVLRSMYIAHSQPLSMTWNSLIASRTPNEMQFHLAILQECLIDGKSGLGLALRNAARNTDVPLADVIKVLTLLQDCSSATLLAALFDRCLHAFSELEGQNSSQSVTPAPLRELMVWMAVPQTGTVYDPCCGFGGLLIGAAGQSAEISLLGQEVNPLLWEICHLRLAVHGLEGDLGPVPSDTLNNDLHSSLRADWVFANPPFNLSNWSSGQDQGNFQWGVPPEKNGNFAWIQHALNHLKHGGTALLALPNNALSSTQGGEDQIRRKLVESNCVECIVSLPKYKSGATRIFGALWILRSPSEDRQDTLFIEAQATDDAAELNDVLIARIAETYRGWKAGDSSVLNAEFARTVSMDEIARHNFVLTPSRYVQAIPESGIFEHPSNALKSCIERLNAHLHAASHLDREIRAQFQLLTLES